MPAENAFFVTGRGQQNCEDLHSWGPGVRQNYIIHYVIHGAGYLETEGKRYRVETGQSFITFPGRVIHYYPDKENPWEYLWIDFVGDTIEEMIGNTCFSMKHPVCEADPTHSLELYFRRLCDIDIYYHNKLEATGILVTILGIYGDLFPVTRSDVVDQKDNRLSKALVLIQSNYHKSEFHISKLCEMLSINRATLYRLFRSTLFCAPNEYLLNYRLEQAKKLLKLGFSVKNTAVSCGFADPFYFSRAFKKRVGFSPSDYNGMEDAE